MSRADGRIFEPSARVGSLAEPEPAGIHASRRAPVTLIAAIGVAVVLQIAGAPLASGGATAAACLAILLLGLPHGALDVALIRREGTGGLRGMAPLLTLYLACAAVMWGVWRFAPVLALALFLAIAIAHFAEDWRAARSPFLAVTLAAALLTAPALLHRTALTDIFIALTGRTAGGETAQFLLLLAPVALCGALVALASLALAGRFDLAMAGGASLAGMIVLPPALGFALFFGLCHSPRHFQEALSALSRRRLTQWSPLVAPTMLGALAIGAVLYRTAPTGAASARFTAATFMLLSVLTVPHMTVPLLLRSPLATKLPARRRRGAQHL